MTIHKIKIVFAICFLLSHGIMAQDLSSDVQEIVKSFEAQLEEANKIAVKPIIVPTIPVKKKYVYSVTIVPLDIKYQEPTIKPIAAEPDLPFSTSSFLLKAGIGNISNPKLEILYANTDQNKLDYSVFLHHYGLNNDQEVNNQRMSDSEAGLSLKWRVKENQQLEWNANGYYQERGLFFIYDSPLNNEKRTRFNVRNELVFRNIDKLESKIDYKLGFVHSLLRLTNQNVNENKMEFHGEISKSNDEYVIKFPVDVTAVQQTLIDDLYSVHFVPQVKLNNERWMVSGGMALSYDTYLKGAKLWPFTLIDYALSGKKMHLYLQSGQQQSANDLHSISQTNPYVQSRLSSLTNSIRQYVGAGFRGETVSLGYQAEVTYNIHYNFISFLNTDSLTPYFGNTNFSKVNYLQFKLSGDLALNSHIDVGGILIKNFYSNENDEVLYGINSLELNAFAQINLLKNKISFKPLLTIRDRSTALANTPIGLSEIQLNNQVDCSVHVNAVFGKFGIYAEANNLLENKYSRWYGYPGVGLHFNGGVILKF